MAPIKKFTTSNYNSLVAKIREKFDGALRGDTSQLLTTAKSPVEAINELVLAMRAAGIQIGTSGGGTIVTPTGPTITQKYTLQNGTNIYKSTEGKYYTTLSGDTLVPAATYTLQSGNILTVASDGTGVIKTPVTSSSKMTTWVEDFADGVDNVSNDANGWYDLSSDSGKLSAILREPSTEEIYATFTIATSSNLDLTDGAYLSMDIQNIAEGTALNASSWNAYNCFSCRLVDASGGHSDWMNVDVDGFGKSSSGINKAVSVSLENISSYLGSVDKANITGIEVGLIGWQGATISYKKRDKGVTIDNIRLSRNTTETAAEGAGSSTSSGGEVVDEQGTAVTQTNHTILSYLHIDDADDNTAFFDTEIAPVNGKITIQTKIAFEKDMTFFTFANAGEEEGTYFGYAWEGFWFNGTTYTAYTLNNDLELSFVVNGTSSTIQALGATLPAATLPVVITGNFLSGSTEEPSQNFVGKIYYIKAIDENDNVIAELIPVKKSDNTICLYNKTNGTYIYKTGSGSVSEGTTSNSESGGGSYTGPVEYKRVSASYTTLSTTDWNDAEDVYKAVKTNEGDRLMILVRHSERDSSSGKQAGLNANGLTILQQTAAPKMKGAPFADSSTDAYYSTNVKRTVETAYFIGNARGASGCTQSSLLGSNWEEETAVDHSGDTSSSVSWVAVEPGPHTHFKDTFTGGTSWPTAQSYYKNNKTTCTQKCEAAINWLAEDSAGHPFVFLSSHDLCMVPFVTWATDNGDFFSTWNNDYDSNPSGWLMYMAGVAVIVHQDGSWEVYPVKCLDKGKFD